MKFSLFIALIFVCCQAIAQPIDVEVTGNVFNNATDSIFIAQSQNRGVYNDFLGTKIDRKGNFKLKGTLPSKDYYVLRVGTQHINLVLRDSSKIVVNADASNLAAYSNITGSDESVALNEFVINLEAFNRKRDSAAAYLQQYPEQQAEIQQSFQNEYYQFNAYRQRFLAQNANSPALIAVISSLDLDKEFSFYEAVIQQLMVGFKGSPMADAAYETYLKVKKQREAGQLLAPGKPAPDFTQNDVNGSPISLSSLKGKVVLIDFWASWCGPCRKENPNVVKLYEKYKDAGFTVLSVSLDSDVNAWKAAIEKDKLVWPHHVSDLKKWSNEVARLYQVSGIPFTVLVDKEGTIIDTRLRGVELERALATIFGF